MSEIPSEVKKQKEKAEELQRQIGQSKADTKGQSQGEKKPKSSSESQTSDENANNQQNVQAGAQTQDTPAESAQQGQGDDDAQLWKAKYLTLKGKYDAEINADTQSLMDELNRLKTENELLQERLLDASDTIGVLNETIAKIQAQQASGTAGSDSRQQATDETEQHLLRKEDFEEYGEQFSELVDLINQQAREIERLKATSTQGEYKSTEQLIEDYYKELSELCPRWQLINIDKKFIKWLEEHDPARGMTRMQMLQERYQALDAKGSAYFFNTFLETLQPHERRIYEVRRKQESPDAAAGQSTYNAGTIEEQVMPDSTGAPTQPQETRITADMIKQAAESFAKGKITVDEYEDLVKSFQKQLAHGG